MQNLNQTAHEIVYGIMRSLGHEDMGIEEDPSANLIARLKTLQGVTNMRIEELQDEVRLARSAAGVSKIEITQKRLATMNQEKDLTNLQSDLRLTQVGRLRLRVIYIEVRERTSDCGLRETRLWKKWRNFAGP